MNRRQSVILMSVMALAGCAQSGAPGEADLRVTASWQPWGDDAYPHLIIGLSNLGGKDVQVGPGGQDIAITGPTGAVSVHWGDSPFARTIRGGQAVSVGLHPRVMGENMTQLVFAIDHAHGNPRMPPAGNYQVCVGHGDCVAAELK